MFCIPRECGEVSCTLGNVGKGVVAAVVLVGSNSM